MIDPHHHSPISTPPAENPKNLQKDKKKCEHCNKKKKILMTCTCGKTFCIMHYSPNLHNCIQILHKKDTVDPSLTTATGAFKKIDKI